MNMQNPLLFFILFLAEMVSAQPTIEWQKSYGGSYFDEPNSVQQTPDGGYLAAGLTISTDFDVTNNNGIHDFWFVKLNSDGDLLWQKALGGDDTDWMYGAQVTSDGGCIATGFTESNNGYVSGFQGSKDVWVVKIGPNGDFEWQKTLGGGFWDEGWDIQETAEGGYIVVGSSNSIDGDVTGNHGYADFWIVKLSHFGDIEWQKSLGGTGVDVAYAVKQTVEGGYIVVGESDSKDGDVIPNNINGDFWIVKLTALGEIEWQKTLGSPSLDRPNDVYQTKDGGYIVTGIVGNGGNISGHHGGAFDVWVVKLKPQGDVEWTKTLGGSKEDYAHSIQQTTDGGYIIAGHTISTNGDATGNNGGKDAWVIKLSPSGELQWQQTYGGTMADVCYYIQQTADQGYVFAGYNWSTDGDASTCNGYNDFWIVKLSPESTPTTHPHTQGLTVFPNPSTGLVTLQIPPEETIFKIQLIDLQGRIVHEENGPNTTFDLSPFPKGSYLLSVRSESGQMWVGKIQKI